MLYITNENIIKIEEYDKDSKTRFSDHQPLFLKCRLPIKIPSENFHILFFDEIFLKIENK